MKHLLGLLLTFLVKIKHIHQIFLSYFSILHFWTKADVSSIETDAGHENIAWCLAKRLSSKAHNQTLVLKLHALFQPSLIFNFVKPQLFVRHNAHAAALSYISLISD